MAGMSRGDVRTGVRDYLFGKPPPFQMGYVDHTVCHDDFTQFMVVNSVTLALSY